MQKSSKKKPSLNGVHVPLRPERTRIRTEVARNTVDVGTHDVIIQRPRYPTEEERQIWPDTEIVFDIIKVSFERDSDERGPYRVKASVCHYQKGTSG